MGKELLLRKICQMKGTSDNTKIGNDDCDWDADIYCKYSEHVVWSYGLRDGSLGRGDNKQERRDVL